jgi:hypothetical protein
MTVGAHRIATAIAVVGTLTVAMTNWSFEAVASQRNLRQAHAGSPTVCVTPRRNPVPPPRGLRSDVDTWASGKRAAGAF